MRTSRVRRANDKIRRQWLVFRRPFVNGSPYAIRPLSRPVLSCLSVLSVTLVYCGQTVGWIKMKLGTQVGLGPAHIVLDGDPALSPKGAQRIFLAHTSCGQMAGWIKMPLGREVGLDPSDICVRWGPSSPSQKWTEPNNFRPMFIVAKQLDESRYHLVWR